MNKVNKKRISKAVIFSFVASLISVIPVTLTASTSFADTLDTLQFPRAKVTSAWKNTGRTSYAACFRTSGTCTVQRNTQFEWSLPSGGYFKLERSVNPSAPWRVLSCTSGGSCTIEQTIGYVYAYKPNQYFIYRAPNESYNWVFSLGDANPYNVAVGADISWSFDGPGTGVEGPYSDRPSSVTAGINGAGRVGNQLTATSTYVGVDVQVSYQWIRSTRSNLSSSSNISGATNSTYTTTTDDSGKFVGVTVTVRNFFGSRSQTSSSLEIQPTPERLDPTFGTVTSTLGGYTVNITNYDGTYTYQSSVGIGSVTTGTPVGSNLPLIVTGLDSSQSAVITVLTSKSGAPDGGGTVSGTSLASAITPETGPVGRWVASSISQNGNSFIVADQGGYLYRSTDNGRNWSQIGGAVARNWSALAQSSDGTKIFATVAGGRIHKSLDSGATWTQTANVENWRSISCVDQCQFVVAASPYSNVAGASGNKSGVLVASSDSGASWVQFQVEGQWRAVSTGTGNFWAAVAYGGQVQAGVGDQTIPGAPSASTSLPLTNVIVEGPSVWIAHAGGMKFGGLVANSQDYVDFSPLQNSAQIVLSRDTGQILQCGTDGLLNFVNAASKQITPLNSGGATTWSSCAASGDNSKLMATSVTGAIYISTDGGANWSTRSIDSGNVKRRAIVASENGTEVYAAVYGGKLEYSNDGGETWVVKLDTTQNWIGMCASTSLNKIYAVGYLGFIYQSADSGATWEKVPFKKLPWSAIACSSDGSKVVATTKGLEIYNTTNSGGSWTPRDQKRKWVGVAASSSGNKFAAVVEGGFVYTSSNSGDNWSQQGASRKWSAIASSSSGNNLVATVANGKIYVSSDSGQTWSAKGSDRNWLNVVSSASGKKLIAVVGTGRIYTSSNSGSTWTARESARNWRALFITGNGNRAFAADFGKKLYSSSDSGESWSAL